MKKILITGHRGLIGRGIWPLLARQGYQLAGIDKADGSGDITHITDLKKALNGCHGVIHLAAVSRVIWGEKDPQRCRDTNVTASKNLLKLAINSPLKPWIMVASSREVYGEQQVLPVTEDIPLQPINVYGKAKAAMEEHTIQARDAGLNTAIVRLANVRGEN